MTAYFLDDLTRDKFKILYFLARSNFALTNAQIITVGLDNGWAHYYDLQQSIAYLAEKGLLALVKKPIGECYCISESGRQAVEQFGKRLAQSVRDEIDAYIEANREKLTAAIEHLSTMHKYKEGSYVVDCRVVENDETLLALSINVVSHEIANQLMRAWPQRAQDVYAKVLQLLEEDQ